MKRYARHVTIMAIILGLGLVAPAFADSWNEKTILTFSEPVAIPGVSLEPGTYVFKIANPLSSPHMIAVYTKDEQKQLATAMAVPIRRSDTSSDIVVKFNPTEAGAPPALKAWFYPGSRYGHEFIYPADQAKHIAERTKTLVLTQETSGKGAQATLRTIDAAGAMAPFKGDEETMKEWDTWAKGRADRANQANTTGSQSSDRADALMVQSRFKGQRVGLDTLEDNTSKYIGQDVSVDGEVAEILGPRVFLIDEPDWIDFEHEMIVAMPTNLAALVREGDRVTIEGTVQPAVKADIDREVGWFSDPKTVLTLRNRPVILARRVVGGTSDRVMVIERSPAKAVATTGGNTIDDAATIASGDDALVGRQVNLDDLKVVGAAKHVGFFVSTKDRTLYVSGAQGALPSVKAGDTVSVQGVVMEMPKRWREHLDPPSAMNRTIYVYATNVQTGDGTK